MSDFEACPVGTAKRLASLEPQPIVLPSLDEVREVLRQSEGRFLADAAQAVLDLIASSVPVWVPVEPGAVVKAGTLVRYEDTAGMAATEYSWSGGCSTKHPREGSRFFVDPRTVPVEPVDNQVERVAKAIHDADSESDTEQWTCEPQGVRETYRRLARAALGADR